MCCLARLMRLAMVASGTRNAAAICAVLRPPTARSVSAPRTCGASSRSRSPIWSSVVTGPAATPGYPDWSRLWGLIAVHDLPDLHRVLGVRDDLRRDFDRPFLTHLDDPVASEGLLDL